MVSDWEVVSLVEHCKKIGSGATPRGGSSVYLEEGEVTLIRSQNIYNDGFKRDGLVFITGKAAEKLKNVIVKEDDILLNITGDSVARVCMVDSQVLPARVNQHVSIIRPKESSFNPLYLRYQLVSPQVQQLLLNYASAGATRNALTKSMIENLRIPKPDLDTQKNIAHILGSLDDKIELNRQMNETLEAMAQALFKSWFVDFDPVIDNALAAGNAIPDAFAKRAEQRKGIEKKDHSDTQNLFPDEFEFTDEMGWIPKGWEVKESGDLFDVRDGTHDSPKKSDEGKYLITSRHITSGVIDYPNAYLISQDDFDEVNKRSLVESYDILITMIGTVGVSMLVLQDEIDFAIKNVGLFKTSNNKSYAVFFYLYLNSNYMTQFLDSRLAGTTQKYLTLKVLRALPVVTPDNKTLSHFVNNMSPIFKKIHSNHEQIGILAKLRDTLLPKLMSGEIRIPDAAAMVEEV